MKYEIERKFLLAKLPQKIVQKCSDVQVIRSYYLSPSDRVSCYLSRVADKEEFFRIKKQKTDDPKTRKESVAEIKDFEEANRLSQKAKSAIEKVRYTFRDKGQKWEIDVYSQMDLVIAECEITATSEEKKNEVIKSLDKVPLPSELEGLVIMEVTAHEEFYNYNLSLLKLF